MCPDHCCSRQEAFTLIEVLISISIAVALSGVAISGFMQMRQVAKRNQALTDLAQEAAYIHQRMASDLAMCAPGSQLRFERLAASSLPGSPDHALRVAFQGELPDRSIAAGLDQPFTWHHQVYPYFTSLVQLGWEWRPPAPTTTSKVGTLSMGRSSGVVRKKKIGSFYFMQLPQPRRSSLRHPDDNDYRLLPNANARLAASGLAAWQSMIPGDYTDLFGEDRNPLNDALDAGEDLNNDTVLTRGRLAPVSLQVKSMQLAWVSFDGQTTSLNAASGLTPGGGEVAVFDGLYRDGRLAPATLAPFYPRPAILRVQLTLVAPESGIERSFSFSFQLGEESLSTEGL